MIKIDGIYTRKSYIKTISKFKNNTIRFTKTNDWNSDKKYRNKLFRDIAFLWYINIL